MSLNYPNSGAISTMLGSVIKTNRSTGAQYGTPETETSRSIERSWIGTNVISPQAFLNDASVSEVITALTFFARAVSLDTSSLAQHDTAFLPSNVTERAIQITSELYSAIVTSCQEIIDDTDLSDEESRNMAVERLSLILRPFASVLAVVFNGILRENSASSTSVDFLLTDLMLKLSDIKTETRIFLITNFIYDTKIGFRYAAVRALDNMGLGQAKNILKRIYSAEPNVQIKAFIESSLRGN